MSGLHLICGLLLGAHNGWSPSSTLFLREGLAQTEAVGLGSCDSRLAVFRGRVLVLNSVLISRVAGFTSIYILKDFIFPLGLIVRLLLSSNLKCF